MSALSRERDGKREAETAEREISLLVALLVRYPEIGRVRVTPTEQTLRLSFILREIPGASSVRAFERRVRLALEALARLGGERPRTVGVSAASHGDLAVLEVKRDIDTLAVEEFPIVIGIIKDDFGNLLIVDEDGQGEIVAGEEEERALASTLDHLRGSGGERTLIGFRDGGRVLVFNEV